MRADPKRPGIVLLAILCGLGVARAGDGPRLERARHVEKTGGYSLVPPEGWTAQDLPGMKFQILVAPVQPDFTPNITVADEVFVGSVEEYLEASIDALKRVLKNVRILEKNTEFQTSHGLKGARLIIEDEQNGRRLRQIFYIFGNGETEYVLTCSNKAEDGDKLDASFEQAMKTFRFETDRPVEAMEAKRHEERAGGYSLVPPAGWIARNFPGFRYQILIGPPDEDVTPNILVADEEFEGSIEEFVKESILGMSQILKNLEIRENSEFQTVDGLKGVRLVVENEQNGKQLRQIQYYFERDKTKYVLTCTSRAQNGDKLDARFDQAMRTFRFEAP